MRQSTDQLLMVDLITQIEPYEHQLLKESSLL
jgi:hypothetical protein